MNAYHRLVLLLAFLLAGCDSTPSAPPTPDVTLSYVVPSRTFSEGSALTAETELLTAPGQIQTRIDLLWYYRGQFGNPYAERAGDRQVLWFIENKPRAAVLATPIAELSLVPDRSSYDAAKAVWLRHLEGNPKDGRILGNAGVFLWRDDVAKAVPLLEQAHQLEPENADWPQALAEAYRKQAMAAAGPQRQALAKLSLAMYERAADRAASVRQRMILFARAGSIARHIGDQGEAAVAIVGKAVELAQTLEPGPDRALIEHASHVTLGLFYLNINMPDIARDTCLASAARVIEHQFVSLSDLDMTLAKELLARGEKEAVIKYLAACAKATRSSEAMRWIETITSGGTPEFGDYLH